MNLLIMQRFFMDNKFNRKALYVLISFIYIFTLYVIYYNFSHEVDFQRFSNIFVAFMDLNLYGYVHFDFYNMFPFFYSKTNPTYGLPIIWNGLINSASYCPNMVLLYTILVDITALQPQTLMTISFGGLFTPLIYLTMTKEYTGNYQIPTILTTISGILYLISATTSFSSFYAAGVCFPLIFITFMCIKKYYDNLNKPIFSLLSIILFFSLALYWHTAHMRILFFISSLWITSTLLQLRINPTKGHLEIKKIQINNLYIAVLVLSVAFSQLWKSSYLSNFFSSFDFYDFFSRLNIKFHGGIPYSIPYAFDYKSWELGKIYFHSTILILLIASIIWAIPIIIWAYSFKSKYVEIKSNTPFIFGLSILVAQILDVIFYSLTGGISFFYVPLFFPIFGIYMFYSIKINKYFLAEKIKQFITLSLLFMIILNSVMVYCLFNTHEMGLTSITKYNDTESSFNWLYFNMNKNLETIADFNIIGKYLQRECKISRPNINYKYLTPESYSILVGDNTTITQDLANNYVVLDHATMLEGLPIYPGTFQSRLIESKFYSIDNAKSQNKIYADDCISIFVFRDPQA